MVTVMVSDKELYAMIPSPMTWTTLPGDCADDTNEVDMMAVLVVVLATVTAADEE
jgi:hypothetical protein